MPTLALGGPYFLGTMGECVCPDWRSGLKCQNYIGVCNSATCNEKGICADSGENGKTGFLCNCVDDFCGLNCEHEINDVCNSAFFTFVANLL